MTVRRTEIRDFKLTGINLVGLRAIYLGATNLAYEPALPEIHRRKSSF